MDETVDTAVGVSVAAALMTPPTLRSRNLPFQFVHQLSTFFSSWKRFCDPLNVLPSVEWIFSAEIWRHLRANFVEIFCNPNAPGNEWESRARIRTSPPPDAIWRRRNEKVKKSVEKNFLISTAAESNQQLLSTPSVGRHKVGPSDRWVTISFESQSERPEMERE